MKRFRNQHSFLSLALAMLIALFATAMVAQVNVNAPNALKKRSNAPASQKQESKPAEKPHPQGNRAKPQSHNDGVAVAPNGSVNGTVATGVVSGKCSLPPQKMAEPWHNKELEKSHSNIRNIVPI